MAPEFHSFGWDCTASSLAGTRKTKNTTPAAAAKNAKVRKRYFMITKRIYHKPPEFAGRHRVPLKIKIIRRGISRKPLRSALRCREAHPRWLWSSASQNRRGANPFSGETHRVPWDCRAHRK